MRKRRTILKSISMLILSALIILFIHSETSLFDEHTDDCKDLDLCLILDKAHYDSGKGTQIPLYARDDNFTCHTCWLAGR